MGGPANPHLWQGPRRVCLRRAVEGTGPRGAPVGVGGMMNPCCDVFDRRFLHPRGGLCRRGGCPSAQWAPPPLCRAGTASLQASRRRPPRGMMRRRPPRRVLIRACARVPSGRPPPECARQAQRACRRVGRERPPRGMMKRRPPRRDLLRACARAPSGRPPPVCAGQARRACRQVGRELSPEGDGEASAGACARVPRGRPPQVCARQGRRAGRRVGRELPPEGDGERRPPRRGLLRAWPVCPAGGRRQWCQAGATSLPAGRREAAPRGGW